MLYKETYLLCLVTESEYIILRVLLFCLLRTLPLSYKWGVIQTPSLECCNLKQCRVYTYLIVALLDEST